MAILNVSGLAFPFETDSPFLFAVYHDDKSLLRCFSSPAQNRACTGKEDSFRPARYPAGNEKMGPDASLRGRSIGSDFGNPAGWSMYHGEAGVPGFPKHPHRGFETISVSVRGFVDHVDSLGAAGRFGDGDVQWMTAGEGISHAEMFPCLARSGPNEMEFFQIWLNLPRAKKMAPPNFQMYWSEDIPTVAEKGAVVRLVAGALPGFAPALPPPPDSYASDPTSQLLVVTLKLDAGAAFTLPKQPGATAKTHRNLYLYSGGGVTVAGQPFNGRHRLTVDAGRDVEIRAAADNAEPVGVLCLGGRDLDEPVVQHGRWSPCFSAPVFTTRRRRPVRRQHARGHPAGLRGLPAHAVRHLALAERRRRSQARGPAVRPLPGRPPRGEAPPRDALESGLAGMMFPSR